MPHELNRLILANKKMVLSLLFKAVSETLLEFGKSRLGGTLGIIAVLHTWDQTLKDHFHLHCLVPAGALSLDQNRWIAARNNFLFPVKALSRVFRGKFLSLLQRARDRGKIQPINDDSKASRKKLDRLCEKAFGSPQTVLDYLGRYTHRVALSNDRILDIENGQVILFDSKPHRFYARVCRRMRIIKPKAILSANHRRGSTPVTPDRHRDVTRVSSKRDLRDACTLLQSP